MRIDAAPRCKEKKNVFLLPPEMEIPPLYLKGNYIAGTKLLIFLAVFFLTLIIASSLGLLLAGLLA